MDKLQQCAKAFEQLLDKKYRIVIYGISISDTTISRITDKILPIAKD